MKCREVRQLVYLSREGEVAAETRRQVLQHAASCRRCAYELRQADSVAAHIAHLRSLTPQVHARRDLTDHIMHGVESARRGAISARPTAAAWSFRRIQVACTMAAAAMVAAFFIQNLADTYRMASLELRLKQVPASLVSTLDEPPLASVGLRTVAQIGRLLAEPPAASTAGLRERLELREAVRSFFSVLKDGPPGFAAEVQRLRAKYPELWLISPLHTLSSRDRLVLVRQGASLMKDLRTVVQSGAYSHEK